MSKQVFVTLEKEGAVYECSPKCCLVHGAWADGSSWSAVIERLQARNYRVTAPRFAFSSLAGDVERLREVLNRQSGPTVVAAHSYGGQIMTGLGTDVPNVIGLVYVAAFALDRGESIGKLLSGSPTPWPPENDFVNHFAADVDAKRAKVMCAVQQPFNMMAFADVMETPAGQNCARGNAAVRRSLMAGRGFRRAFIASR